LRTPTVRVRLTLLALLPLLAHCAGAPHLEGVEPSHAIAAAETSRIDRAVIAELGDHPDESGVRLLEDNALAFAYRAATAEAAGRSLDVQYYIWKDDLTGRLLASELMRAAERGVRVRLLIDDADARAKHDIFRIADQHPLIEVRIFNPFYNRYGSIAKIGEFLLRGSRLNRRMHNKAWIVDNRMAILGGRNIGDEYFGASPHSNFADLDVIVTGPIVADVSREFDAYWNSENAVPVSRFDTKEPKPGELDNLIRLARDFPLASGDTPYIAALRDERRRAELIEQAPAPLKVRNIQLLVDEPTKIGTPKQGMAASKVLSGLDATIGQATQETLIVSPYFVPGEEGARSLVDAVVRGMRVAVLTNSLAATDVAAVHTGYARYRRDLLRGGVELYEMKRTAGDANAHRELSVLGSSGATLHTKAMVIDRRWAFIGSMNIDPRSANLNTEMGVLVDSPELAEQLRQQFERTTSPDLSYHVVLEEHEGLVWYDRVQGKERRTENEPDASILERLGVTLLRLVPIESQL
jgi:putative cardiolipin synthase